MSDPIEVVMEEALRPSRYLSEHASFSLVNELGFGALLGHLAANVGAREAAAPWSGLADRHPE